ncbi:MAG TPA: SprT family zinc-dependent metalloprotease [Bacteroidales bacterium]|nr:SprT family zinc-dependent metalloprotease [Bacteroidales bacterium]
MKEEHSINYKVIYSSRRTIGISIRPDATVIVRVPFRTSERTIKDIVDQKAAWIIKHTTKFLDNVNKRQLINYTNGEMHLFRGKNNNLVIKESLRQYCRFNDGFIEIGTNRPRNNETIKRILYSGYKKEAEKVFPVLVNQVSEITGLKPACLRTRTMKRRWGSCSSKGIITLNTDLIRLADEFIIYVITHELCHLKHHNHGTGFYALLASYIPEWKKIRKEIRSYIVA